METMQPGRSLEEWTEQIKKDVEENPVMVFAKGDKHAAVCGFSHRVMQILDATGVEYKVQNIFADPNVRPALCAYTNWPTTPQIFISGKFVGGCDILTEMYQNGDLAQMLAGIGAPRS